MGTDRERESSFLVQGSILAIASLISRMIGLIYRIPLTAILGDVGNAYLSAAMEVYSILLLISSFSLPLAVSKLVSTRMAKGRRRDAYRIFKAAMVFALVSGTIAGLFVFFGAPYITNLIRNPLSIFAMQALAPTLLVVAVLGVIRGLFQGLGTMVPSAISQLLEQVVNAIVSIWMAYVLFNYGARIGAVLGNRETFALSYAAAGGTIGTGAGAVIALAFILFLFFLFRPNFTMAKASKRKPESYPTIFKLLIWTIVPVLLSTTFYNISTILDLAVFNNIAARQGYEEEVFTAMWGVFAGKFRTLINVPIAFASALAASIVPSVAKAFALNDMKQVRRKIHAGVRYIMIISFPCAIGMGILAGPIMQLLFRDYHELPARLIQVGTISIVFFGLSTLTNAVLQGINRLKVPVVNAVIALILHLFVLVGLMVLFDMHIYAVVISTNVFALIMSILNGISIRKYVRYRQEIPRTFLIPGISSILMGVAVFGVYDLLIWIVGSNALATSMSILVGAFVYFVFMVLLRGLSKKELNAFPKGHLLVAFAQKLRLLK